MKIGISNILMIYSVFLHFGELNAMYPGSGSHFRGNAANQGSGLNSGEYGMNPGAGSNFRGNAANQGSGSNSGGYGMNPGPGINFGGYGINPGAGSNFGGYGMNQVPGSNIGGYGMHPGSGLNLGGNANYAGSGFTFRGNTMNSGSGLNPSGPATHPASGFNPGGYATHPGSGSNVRGNAMNQGSGSNENENPIIFVRGKRIDLREYPSLEGTSLYHGYASVKSPGKHARAVVRYEAAPNATVFYGFTPIELWLDPITNKVAHAYFKGCYLPLMSFYKNNNFLIRWVRLKDEHGVDHDIVAYVGDEGRLIGVRPTKLAKGYKTIQVFPSKWLIIYFWRHYDVFVNSMEKRVKKVQVEDGNMPDYEHHRFTEVTVANIKFNVYSAAGDGNPSGAVLVEDYFYNIGESFFAPEYVAPEKKKIGRQRKNPLDEDGNERTSSSSQPRKKPAGDGKSGGATSSGQGRGRQKKNP